MYFDKDEYSCCDKNCYTCDFEDECYDDSEFEDDEYPYYHNVYDGSYYYDAVYDDVVDMFKQSFEDSVMYVVDAFPNAIALLADDNESDECFDDSRCLGCNQFEECCKDKLYKYGIL